MNILTSIKCFFDKIICILKGKFMKKHDSKMYGYLYDYFNDNYIAVDGEGTNHSPVKLMKLFFLTYIVYYRYYSKEIMQKMELWKLGPVSNVMYAKMNDDNEFSLRYDHYTENSNRTDYPSDLLKIMEAINNFYGKMSGETLVRLVHQDSGWMEDFPDSEKQEFNGDLSQEVTLDDSKYAHIELNINKYNNDYCDINNPKFPEFINYCNSFKNKNTIIKKLPDGKKYTFFYDNSIKREKVEEYINNNIDDIQAWIKEDGCLYVFIIEDNGELYFD